MRVIRRKNARPRVNAIRSQSSVSKVTNSGRRVEIGFLDTDKIYRMERDKVQKFRAPGSKTSGISLKNLSELGEERGAAGVEEQPEI